MLTVKAKNDIIKLKKKFDDKQVSDFVAYFVCRTAIIKINHIFDLPVGADGRFW